jgi:molybdopterin molybdotransferase
MTTEPNLVPPRLRNDCFAMPQGVAWVPVEEALARLRAVLYPITATETIALHQGLGRVLADDMQATRANPPQANSAVDGYGFVHAATGTGVCQLPLVSGRAAAGQPFTGAVPAGHAVRILTGAILPEGVDTVVLEEDCAISATAIAFDGPIKPRANTRRAGEDIAQGATALPKGHKLRAPDLALLAATGIAMLPVYRRLRVGILSTGDEIVTQNAAPHQIYDANRPMLLALAQSWGMEPVDLGHSPDDTDLIRSKLTEATTRADVILTSGGASAGDEDHVSRLLASEGQLSSWRIAMKPGRPLALAMWQGIPVFGLPGNPVAALICALIFARPALSALSGAGWTSPQKFTLPASFSKTKKAGRREYLRARITADGQAEVFASEGSGRISGLAWATGLVELPDEALQVNPGDPVTFLPFGDFFA